MSSEALVTVCRAGQVCSGKLEHFGVVENGVRCGGVRGGRHEWKPAGGVDDRTVRLEGREDSDSVDGRQGGRGIRRRRTEPFAGLGELAAHRGGHPIRRRSQLLLRPLAVDGALLIEQPPACPQQDDRDRDGGDN